jgi:hypothetical protein
MVRLHHFFLFCLVLLGIILSPLLASAKTFSVSSTSQLKSALDSAQAGDEIVLAGGSYGGTFTIGKNSGTADKPIILRAENRHRAILQGSGNWADPQHYGLNVQRPYWIIDGLEIRDYSIGVLINTHHVEVRHNLIHRFGARGVDIQSSNDNFVHHNVIAESPAPDGYSTYAGIDVTNESTRNQVEDNIVYSITNDGHQCGDAGGCSVGAKRGYAIQVRRSSWNTVRGNLLMDSAKGGLRVFSTPDDATSTDHNTITDNISAFSEAGTISVSDAKSSYNLVANNLIYGAYYAAWSAKGNIPGFNIFRHNTTILTVFSRLGGLLNTADNSGRSSVNTTVQDNLLYADHANPGTQYLWNVYDWSDAIEVSSHNLFWAPGSTANWTKGVTFHSTDVRQEPTFVDPKNGDFSLAPWSPGKGAASDGKDIGVTYNDYLKKSWMRHVLLLPTQEKAPSGKSLAFTTSASHQYQVYVYIPESNPYQGIETFTIETQKVQRDYKNIIALGWVTGAPLRWIYLGTHASDGTLNVSWTQSASVGKLYIRQMPTVEEAYGWIAEVDTSEPKVPSPGGMRIVGPNP